MKRAVEDLDLEYINKRIDRLIKRFNEFEELVFRWKKKDSKEIDELKKCVKTSGGEE